MKFSRKSTRAPARLNLTLPALALAVAPCFGFISTACAQTSGEFTPLFNGVNLDGWYTWDNQYKKNNDVENYYQVRNGELVILDIPETDDNKAFGYLGTNADYADYHLRFQYQWGEKKYAPRKNLLRDSGVLYHLVGSDRIWPTCLESQVQEGDTGDFFGLGGASITSMLSGGDYSPTGDLETSARPRASEVADTLTGWNESEVIVRGDSAVHIVNGKVVNRVWDARFGGDPLTAGKIAFQAEGATIRYRNIEIRDLVSESPRVLLFSETRGFNHGSIPDALNALEDLAGSVGMQTDRAADSEGVFTDANLANYDAVVWVMTTGDVLNEDEQAAFEHFIRSGGGYAGIHAASDTEYDWPWYGELVGAYFDRHPAVQTARQNVEDASHESTTHLGSSWTRTDEWYDYRTNPRGQVNVLLSLDESSYSGGGMGDDHPSAWYHEYDGGRSWYTGGGHTSDSYSEPDFLEHLLGGLIYAAGREVGTPISGQPAIPNDAIDRDGWTLSASQSRAGEGTANSVDDNVGTRWSTGAVQAPGMSFDINFGESVNIDGIVLDAGASGTDYPRGYEVLVSNDGSNFSSPVASGNGNGRGTVINFSAVETQFVRIVQTGSDNGSWWSIHEIYVSGAETPTSGQPAIPEDAIDRDGWTLSASQSRTGEGPTNSVDGNVNTRWSTGAVQAPGMSFDIDFGESISIDGIVLDAGASGTDYPRGYEVLVSDDGTNFSSPAASGNGDGRGTVIDFAAVETQFVRIVQTGSDNNSWWSIHEIYVSGAETPTSGQPTIPEDAIDRDGWTLSASQSRTGEGPTNSVDGNVNTRWSTGAVQSPGMSFDIDLGESINIDGIVLDAGASGTDYPRGYEVLVSNDGSNFSTPVASGNGNGRGTEINFPSVQAQFVRIVQTGSDNNSWWSIHEIYISGVGESTPLARDGWTAMASSTGNGESTSAAFDADVNSRWSTGAFQVPGQFFQLDLGSESEFDRLVLSTSTAQPFDFPRAYEVRVSTNGQDFGDPIAVGAGSSITDIILGSTTARYIRIEQTGETSSRYWSIYDLQLFMDR